MPKTIVFCADGTWNGPEVPGATAGDGPTLAEPSCSPQLTNVCKLFGWLQGDLVAGTQWGTDEMEKAFNGADGQAVQIAKYIHGVGNSPQLLAKVAGGAFGVGVTARIARGYTYISRNYVAGDRIVIVGFSRGAYTARALAGLIAGEGLLRPELASDPDTKYDTAAAAWYRWRHGHDTTLQKIVDGMTELVAMHEAFSKAATLSDASFVPVQVTAVAVWDTVGSLGIPLYHDGSTFDLFRFCDNKLSTNVGLGLHAVSIDEQRQAFVPTLWDDAPNVTQALFAGGHCDVGGGYAQHTLSDVPLLWFIDRLQHPDVGLKFAAAPPVEVTPDAFGARHSAWLDDPAWAVAGLALRSFRPGLVVNDSVRQRMGPKPETTFPVRPPPSPYAPKNLPGAADAPA